MCVKHSVQHLLNLRVMLNTVHNKDNSFLPYNYLPLGVCLLANSRTIHLLTEAIKPGSPVRLHLLQKALTSNHPVLYILPYKYLTLPSPPPNLRCHQGIFYSYCQVSFSLFSMPLGRKWGVTWPVRDNVLSIFVSQGLTQRLDNEDLFVEEILQKFLHVFTNKMLKTNLTLRWGLI